MIFVGIIIGMVVMFVIIVIIRSYESVQVKYYDLLKSIEPPYATRDHLHKFFIFLDEESAEEGDNPLAVVGAKTSRISSIDPTLYVSIIIIKNTSSTEGKALDAYLESLLKSRYRKLLKGGTFSSSPYPW